MKTRTDKINDVCHLLHCRLGQLITMAGLDKKDTPFGRHMSTTTLNGTMDIKSSFVSSNSSYVSSSPPKVAPKPLKPTSKLNTFYGDISSSNRIGEGHHGEKPDKFTAKLIESFQDPAMQRGHGDESFGRPSHTRKTDELYERILRETSGAFTNVGGSDRMEGKGDKQQTKSHTKALDTSSDRGDEKENIMMDLSELTSQIPLSKSQNSEEDPSFIDRSGDGRPTPQPRSRKSSENEDNRLGPKVGKVEPFSLGRRDNSEKESPEHRSRMSDYNYSMDSFEQSYVSERGERVVLDGDLDAGFGDSPSPPPEVIDSEENDF